MSARRLATLPRTDWFRVLADFRAIGWTDVDVARRLAVPDSTLRGWKAGSEPSHYDGSRLLLLYQDVTGRQLIPLADPFQKSGIPSRAHADTPGSQPRPGIPDERPQDPSAGR
ncbi:hypothetical protein [Xanthomonas sacchari]|uniref:hypothetical protein n=1 Tax=Xanthomonas sacchari TaxID=56458 RepID=UPI0022529730|nr:hypothetical protein [Xanthomonas sacchari]MCW0370257.1 hypothetical protein [Xanthomonas sacchari]